jgi:hypothetical protein
LPEQTGFSFWVTLALLSKHCPRLGNSLLLGSQRQFRKSFYFHTAQSHPITVKNLLKFPAIEHAAPRLAKHRVIDVAKSKLQSLPFSQLRKIDCDFHEGVLTLRGKVSTFFLRQMAFAAVRSLDGVEVVTDRIEVR